VTIADDDRDEQPVTLDPSDPSKSSGPSGLSRVIAGARPEDPAALVLARARVASALFGSEAGLGRFRVLERLGSGGMGAVYAAYDPQLDRGVALKTVHVPERGHEAALAEAKALARLAHPNVVPVFDVGIEGDAVYIVMELVRGETLRTWVKDRSLDEVLDAYRQAGQALAAAHAAGLVHRDFKPDNAIVGQDGRVRVVDFGLACEVSEARAAAGTPGYMAPEQAAGTVTPAADQYSFCVALAEALGDAEPPRWIAAIVERGRAADPAARFPSMTELVRALGRDPAKIRRRRVLVALAVALIATAFLVGRFVPVGEAEACDGGAAELAETWHPDAQAASLDRVAQLSEYGRELAPLLGEQLSDHAGRWTAGHREACQARRAGAQPERLERRTACLDGSLAALSVVKDLVTRSEVENLDALMVAVRALPDPAACADPEMLASEVAPPPAAFASVIKGLREDLSRARIEIAAGRLNEARERVDPIVAQAPLLGYAPLLAEALLVSGHEAQGKVDRKRAVPLLTRSMLTAITSNATDIAVEAGARRLWLLGTAGADKVAAAFDGIAQLEALALRGRAKGFPRALLHANIGLVENSRDGRRVQARAALEQALLDARGVTGPGVVELAAIYRGLANASDDPADRERFLDKAEDELTKLLDRNHPQTLETLWRRVTLNVEELARAVSLLRDVCERYEIHVALTTDRAVCWAELAELQSESGDTRGAIDALERAVRLAPTTGAVQIMSPYLSLWRGQLAAAVREFTAELVGLPASDNENWYVKEYRGLLGVGLGRAYRQMRRSRDAHQILQRAVEDLEAAARAQSSMLTRRRLGRARAELAQAGVRNASTIEAARAAVAWLREVGGNPDEIERLERWITGKAEVADSPR
jgi:eukaryotic-like serine/threonine-protein kinase